MRRRSFLGGLGSAVMLAPVAGCRPWLRPSPTVETVTPHQRATVEAMAATFLPSGPGSPGATEADAITTILDPNYAVAGYLAEVVADLDDWCYLRHGGHAFVELDAGAREAALAERMGEQGKLIQSWYKPVYEGVLSLTKLAFFGGLTRAIGTTYVGFPGPSAGYAADSAAGVHVGTGPTIEIRGPGRISSVRVTATLDRAGALIAPDGARHALPAAALDAHEVPAAAGVIAAGIWRLDGAPAWWLALRTDLDERGG